MDDNNLEVIPIDPVYTTPYGVIWNKVEDGAVAIVLLATVLGLWLRPKVAAWFDANTQALRDISEEAKLSIKAINTLEPRINRHEELLRHTRHIAVKTYRLVEQLQRQKDDDNT